LQLSRFNQSKVALPNKIITEANETIVQVKYLIEWVITNPENTQDSFTGSVYLYQLKPDLSTNSEHLTIGTVVKESLKALVNEEKFSQLTKSETINFINDFIKTCNTKTTTISGKTLFTSELNKFPIFYRPNNITYSVITPSSTTATGTTEADSFRNVSDIYNQIKLYPALKKGGYGLIYAKNKVGKPMNFKTTVVPQQAYKSIQTTYGAVGADTLYLLSHMSAIPGKGKINFDDTLYGISLDQFVDEILPKTSSLVRGEELLELLNLIVRFLITHTHAYPGLPPVPVTQDGSNVTDILTEMQNAYTKILNANIRLN
jgi:hypothetical protein